MAPKRALCTVLLILGSCCATGTIGAQAQEGPIPRLTPGSERKPVSSSALNPHTSAPPTVALTVAKGSPLQVALDREVSVKKVGQSVHGRVVEPVYALDKIVVPVGSEVIGSVTRIDSVPAGRRTLSALNADFTPLRKVEVGFSELVLPDGRHFPLHANVTPGSGQVIDFVTAADEKENKNGVKDLASEKTKEAKQQAHEQWNGAMKQLKTPGKIGRLERYGESQLPVHRQFIPAGTVYFAELEEPLDFGREVLTAAMRSATLSGTPSPTGTVLPEGSVVRARLVTPLSSATAHQGQEVEAVLSQPLLDGDRLILPQGSRLKGTVKKASPARRMKKNGQLRIAFSELVPPDGVGQQVVSTLEGVQAGKDANVKLDSEGGAEATTSKSRYLGTAVSLGLAMVAARSGGDQDDAAHSGAAGGLGGFKLVGLVVGAVARSRAFSTSMGAYGAAVSIYSHFIARGREVEFPKNTAMQIGIGTRAPKIPPLAPALSSPVSSLPASELETVAEASIHTK